MHSLLRNAKESRGEGGGILTNYDVMIVGAGAAGLMCAWQASLRGRRVAVIEHTNRIGEKIRISGGGRCNFTNLYTGPEHFLSQNPHFCKSALKRFGPQDFIALVDEAGILWHEKPYEEKEGNGNARGQLFCDGSAQQIIDMLVSGCRDGGVEFLPGTKVLGVAKGEEGFELEIAQGAVTCESLVVASGGLSIPKIGASNFGYELAKKFGLDIVPPRAGLVPLTFDEGLLSRTRDLSGLSVDARVSCGKASFREGLLFTHRGLSGPSILQISSYWHAGDHIQVDFIPDDNCMEILKSAKQSRPKQILRNVLSGFLPQRLTVLIDDLALCEKRIGDLSNKNLQAVSDRLNSWDVTPAGHEGYRTAEVTLGGVDTNGVSSRTFEARNAPGLYFIGEVLDVTGHLGGHNFQWAWSSGWCAAQYV